MPREGYTDKTTFQDIDFNGILNVIINNKRLGAKFTDDLSISNNIITQARNVGKVFRHSPDLAVDKTELAACIDTLLHVLADIKDLPQQKKALDAIKKIDQLKKESFNVCTLDATKVIEDFMCEETRKLSASACEKKQQALQDIATEGDCIKKEMKERQIAFLRDVVQASKAIDRLKTETIDQIVLSKVSAIDEIETVGREEKRAVAKVGKDLKRKALKIKQESKRLRMAIHKEKESTAASLRSSAPSSATCSVSGKRISKAKTIQN